MSNATKEPSNRFWWLVSASCVLPVVDQFVDANWLIHSLYLAYIISLVVIVRREFLENRSGSFFGYKPKSAEDAASASDSSSDASDSN